MEMDVNETASKTCESCGESFGCGADLGSCWCFAIELPADASADLKAKYMNCLCPKCLAAATKPLKEKSPPLVH